VLVAADAYVFSVLEPNRGVAGRWNLKDYKFQAGMLELVNVEMEPGFKKAAKPVL